MSEPEYCSYTSTKIDVEVYRVARAAAALSGQTAQDYISDVVNEAASRLVNRKPIKRKQPPPHPKRPRR